MPDFSRYSNYKPETSYSGVVFGARAPVLEVELNEVQQILNTKLKRVASFFGDTLIPDEDGGMTFNSDTKELSITNSTILAGAFTVYIPQAKVVLTEAEPVAYLKIVERVIASEDPIRNYGVQNNEDFVSNTMIDPRVGVETSRRKVTEVTLSRTDTPISSVITNSDTQHCVVLGAMAVVSTGDTESCVFNYSVNTGSLKDIINKVNQQQTISTRYEDGVLYLGISSGS